MDETESYEEKMKRRSKEKQQRRAKKIKSILLHNASSAEQYMRSLEKDKAELEKEKAELEKEKAELETATEITRRNQLQNSQERSTSITEEAEKNAQMRSTIEAVENILSVFDSSILHPKNKEELEDNPMIEKRVLQFAAKAHFIKTSYDIKPKSSITRSRSI